MLKTKKKRNEEKRGDRGRERVTVGAQTLAFDAPGAVDYFVGLLIDWSVDGIWRYAEGRATPGAYCEYKGQYEAARSMVQWGGGGILPDGDQILAWCREAQCKSTKPGRELFV